MPDERVIKDGLLFELLQLTGVQMFLKLDSCSLSIRQNETMEEREPKVMSLKYYNPGIILHLTSFHFTPVHRLCLEFTCVKLVHTGKNVHARGNASK